MNRASVEVLMSTYNGGKYLKEQLDSLLSQKGDFNLKISVRDDGSTDLTCEILREYKNQHGINVIYGENIGVNASFMELVRASGADFDYFAFCDQDDVWYDFRIQEAVTALSQCNEKTPALWSCMEELTDENLEPYKLMPYPKHIGNFYNAMLQNNTSGHTQVFNRNLRDIYVKHPPEKMYFYDWILYLMACAFGEVCFCENVCGKYRQHGDNVTRYETNSREKAAKRFKRLKNKDYKHISAQLGCFSEIYENQLPEEYKREINRFLINQRNIFKRIGYAVTTNIKRNSAFESLMFKGMYILGVYKE
jgi:glycosyltransferase involved in cell wall biosynthesis